MSAECAASSGVGMGDDPTAIGAGINQGCGMFTTAEVHVAPGRRRVHGRQRLRVHGLRPDRVRLAQGRRARHGRHTLSLNGPVDCDKLATIALYRANGEVAELQEPVGNCTTLPPPAPKCNNGKDDDGDGMIDSRDAAGTTDPDPGCSATTDTTEDSETPTPASCEIEVGLLRRRQALRRPGDLGLRRAQGHLVPPARHRRPTASSSSATTTPSDCSVKAGTAGATFALTNQDITLGTHLAADATCRP